MDGCGLDIPEPGRPPGDETVAFAAELIDRSGKAPVIEAALAHRTGRPRPLPVRVVLTALFPGAARGHRHHPHPAGVPGRLPPRPLLLRPDLLRR